MAQNITKQVKNFLDNDFVIRKCLLRNLISLRALARHIVHHLAMKESNLDAVISGIRRYKRAEKGQNDVKLKKIFPKIKVTTRSNIADMQVQKTRKNLENIGKMNSVVDIEKGEILRVIQAEQSITIVIDDKNLEKFDEVFNKKDYISKTKNLIEVNLQFTEEAQNIKGIIAIVSSGLNAESINIIEIMSSSAELIILVKKEDLLKVLNVVDKLHELA